VLQPGAHEEDDILEAGGIFGDTIAEGGSEIERQDGVQTGLGTGGFVDGAVLPVFLQGELLGFEIADEVAEGVIDIHISGEAGELREVRLREHRPQTALGGGGGESGSEKKRGEEEKQEDALEFRFFHVGVF
ncbi:MAG TPA: hypothetical protein DD636_06550, partial [Anaerolineaceae bacterium]|nr:hypothetical protein [Anaerolineaceae bacterium]